MTKGQVQPRSVAVAIPYSVDEEVDGRKVVSICLVSSRKHDSRFVLPKGGVEAGESSRQAAIRELWEEAGLRPADQSKDEIKTSAAGAEVGEKKSNKVADHKPHKKSPTTGEGEGAEAFIPRAIYEGHEIEVRRGDPSSELASWPEEQERERRWATIEEALELIRWRKDIHHLLAHSSLMI